MTHHRSISGLSSCWVDVQNDGSLDSFAKINNLDSSHLRSPKAEVIVIPTNTYFGGETKFNLFPESSKNILLSLREKSIQTVLYENAREKRKLILKSDDLVLPILLFVGGAALQVGLNVLANLISDHLLRRKKKQTTESAIKVEYAQTDQKDTITRWRKIEGSPKDVIRLLAEEARVLAEQNLSKGARTRSSSGQRKVC